MSGSGDGVGGVPAGWYQNHDGSDTMRYWDGARWTDHVRPIPGWDRPAAQQPGAPAAPAAGSQSPSGPPGGFAGAVPVAGDDAPGGPATSPGGGDGGLPGPAPESEPPPAVAAPDHRWAGPPGQQVQPPDGASGQPVYGPTAYPHYGAVPYPQGTAPAGTGQTNGLAVVSLIASLIWACGAGSLVAIVTGHIARHQIKGSGGRQAGGGLALVGLVLGYLGLVAVVAVVLLVIAIGGSTEVEGQLDDAFSDAAVRIDLEDAAAAQEAWYQERGAYTSSVADLESVGFFSLDGSVYEGGELNLEILALETGYCMQATAASGGTFHHDSATGPGEGACPAAQGSGAGMPES